MKTTDKCVSLQAALTLVPAEKFTLGLGGVTLYRRPMAFALGLATHFHTHGAPHGMTLLAFTAGLECDILLGLGMVESVRTCYFGLEAFGLAPHFTAAAGRGEINIIEETEASLAFGLRASLAGVGFMPSHAWQGTDLLELRPDVKTISDPYSQEPLTAFPAVSCDVAVIHALEADRLGNARIGGNWGMDRELSMVADTVIITADKIVPSLDRADILGPVVDAVVHSPQGAWPTSCHPLYPFDGEAILRYVDTSGGQEDSKLIDQWCQRHAIETGA